MQTDAVASMCFRSATSYSRKRGKWGPRYVGSLRKGAKIGKVAYRLELPTELGWIHDTFMCRN